MDILKIGVETAILITVVIGLRFLFRNLIPRRTFIFLWILVYLRLFIPVSIPSKFSIYSIWNTMSNRHKLGNYNPALKSSYLKQASTGNGNLFGFSDGMMKVLLMICITGSVLLLVYSLVSFRRSYQQLKTSIPIRENDFIKRWGSMQSFIRKVFVHTSDRIGTPLVYGILKPKIVLPKGMKQDDEKQLELVLAHERVHIQRFDLVWKTVSILAICIYWYNPFVWIAYVLLNRDIEIACDEKVMQEYGVEIKVEYATALISLAEQRLQFSPLCIGFGKHAIEERIRCIMKFKKLSTLGLALALVVVAGTTTVFATSAEGNAENKDSVEVEKPYSITVNSEDVKGENSSNNDEVEFEFNPKVNAAGKHKIKTTDENGNIVVYEVDVNKDTDGNLDVVISDQYNDSTNIDEPAEDAAE